MTKKHDLSYIFFPSVTRRCRRCWINLGHVYNLPLDSLGLLGQLDAPHTQNLDIRVPKGSNLREVFRGFAV
jgi:hypothetical protein